MNPRLSFVRKFAPELCPGSMGLLKTLSTLFAIMVISTLSFAQLTYTTSCTGSCEAESCTYSNWAYTDSSKVKHTFTGSSSETIVDCKFTTFGNLDTWSTDDMYYLTAKGNIGTVEYGATLYPAYQVVGIIYAPPGNKSQDGYTDTTTDGTTSSIGSSFTDGQSTTFTEGFGDCTVGCVSASESFGASISSSSSTAFQETFTDATGVANMSESYNPDAINHDQDLFLIWLNPLVSVLGTPGVSPTPTSYSVSVMPTANGETPLPDIAEITAVVMEPNAAGVTTVPATWLNQQYNEATGQYTPGLAAICKNLKTAEYNAGTCTLADQCGCAASDFAPILQQDLLLYSNGTSNAISPYAGYASPLTADISGETTCGTIPTPAGSNCRYVPVPSAVGSTIQEVATLAGPECVGCNNTPNTFQQGDNQSTTRTQGSQTTESVSYSAKAGNNEFSMTATDTWTWTQSQSVGLISGNGYTASVTFNSGTVECGQDIPIYEDTVYHTFVFQQPGPTGTAAASCTTTTATPTFSPAAGTYTAAQTVTVATTTTGAAIYYTTNGTTPTTSSTPYTGPITVSATETVKAISFVPGWNASSVGSAAYTIE